LRKGKVEFTTAPQHDMPARLTNRRERRPAVFFLTEREKDVAGAGVEYGGGDGVANGPSFPFFGWWKVERGR